MMKKTIEPSNSSLSKFQRFIHPIIVKLANDVEPWSFSIDDFFANKEWPPSKVSAYKHAIEK